MAIDAMVLSPAVMMFILIENTLRAGKVPRAH